MKRVIFILSLLLAFSCTELNAQVVVITPDSLSLYNNSLREASNGTEDLENLRTNQNTKNKGKKSIPNKGNVTIIFDPMDPQKNNLVIKASPKK